MRSWVARGELWLALVFVALAVLWIAKAIRMPFWEGFAPEAGFLPLIYGVLLAGLAAAVLVQEWRQPPPAADASLRKPFIVVAALAAAVIALPFAGFAVAVFAMLFFLYAAVERLPLVASLLASGGTTGALYLIFRTWLGVPLP